MGDWRAEYAEGASDCRSTPSEQMRKMQDSGNFGGVMAYREAVKELPFGEVYAEYCRRQGVPCGTEVYENICAYEAKILTERA